MKRKNKTTNNEAVTNNVVPAKYRKRYVNGSCGDKLAARLSKHVTSSDGSVDVARLRTLAERNEVWSASYAKLNAGMQRMTIGNRLRKLTRDGNKITWK
jgi:hypothetical protein